jgi:hypothetical protein
MCKQPAFRDFAFIKKLVKLVNKGKNERQDVLQEADTVKWSWIEVKCDCQNGRNKERGKTTEKRDW